ncbi:MAG: hypothetical protein RM368_34560 [Nostoc sp. DedSLP03]|uniref:hypothetical protein n=1 Tax=Nostoc sp. DedSLP03 TaxID=3075400 RepID=UPI002AD558E8|nr:hypothetical protein [Nostoc sp. DedSLP03]MDZ7970003.1 hypothetical protein [Nostoc sp. DedSLP03]
MARVAGDFPVWSTVYGYFWRWSKDGTWLKVHDQLYQWVRVDAGRDKSPSEAAVDSQSVETATMISIDVGYDAGKKIHRRKRHFSVDLQVVETAVGCGRGAVFAKFSDFGLNFIQQFD